MNFYRNIILLTELITAAALGGNTILAQEQMRRLPPAKVTIDEDILMALADEPCRHFEAAIDQFAARQFSKAGEHLRTASAYLRLEAARASDQGREALDASVRELQTIATATERRQIRSGVTLQQAFARAHYALASHHCLRTAHRCCRPVTFVDKSELTRAGHDLRAAATNLERGSRWAGDELDEETRHAVRASKIAAGKLIQQRGVSQSEVQHVIHKLHKKFETLTGRKMLLARPLTPEDDRNGPSIFH